MDSLGAIASDMLSEWEVVDGKRVRDEAGIEKEIDYFSDSNKLIYAELHAHVVRRMAIMMKKGTFTAQGAIARGRELEEIIKEEFEKYIKE